MSENPTQTPETTEQPTSTKASFKQKFDSLKEQVGRAKKSAGAVGAVKGVLADFLSPFGPITLIATLLFGAIAGYTGYVWFGKIRKDLNNELASGAIDLANFNQQIASNKWVTAFSYSTIVTGIFLFFAAGGALGKDKKRGLLAGNVAAIKQMQTAILKLQKDVEILKKAGGLILTPKNAVDYYHNARILTKDGKRAKARKAYETCLSYNKQHIDPHLGYQTLLKDMEGISGARKVYAGLKAKYPNNPVVQYAYALIQENKLRIATLRQLLQKHPNFVPAFAALSESFSYSKMGVNVTLTDRQQEANYIKAFLKSNRKNKFATYFIDAEKATPTVRSIEQRAKNYEKGVFKNMLKNPVTIRVTASGDFHQVSVTIPENIKQIWYRLESMKDFKSTGFMGIKNQATGTPMPKYFFMTRKIQPGVNNIWIKYKNAKDQIIGPLKKAHVVKTKTDQATSMFLKYQWSNPQFKRVMYKYFRRGKHMLIFMFASANAKIFKYVKYSVGSPRMNKYYVRDGQFAGRSSALMTRLGMGNKTLYVQFQLKTGYKSKVLQFKLKLTRSKKMTSAYLEE